jgi:hypothetical protein
LPSAISFITINSRDQPSLDQPDTRSPSSSRHSRRPQAGFLQVGYRVRIWLIVRSLISSRLRPYMSFFFPSLEGSDPSTNQASVSRPPLRRNRDSLSWTDLNDDTPRKRLRRTSSTPSVITGFQLTEDAIEVGVNLPNTTEWLRFSVVLSPTYRWTQINASATCSTS